jgi:hypothetical protein
LSHAVSVFNEGVVADVIEQAARAAAAISPPAAVATRTCSLKGSDFIV